VVVPSAATTCAIVIATRNRRESLLSTLERLACLPDRPPVTVVDNASEDGTAAALRNGWPDVELISLPENLGAYARNVGVEAVAAPYVAFCDDDSWWLPGSLERAVEMFVRYPELALVAARIVVNETGQDDPTCAAMAASPLVDARPGPGCPVLGFIACGVVVRRAAFLEAGGFERRLLLGCEENLLALELATRGWQLSYVPDVVACHAAQPRSAISRRRLLVRNALWIAWLRRPLPHALRATAMTVGAAVRDPRLIPALGDTLRGAHWVIASRRRLPANIERSLQTLEAQRSS
jgi:GT2 family glycosyltransferase